jgi:dTDP-4-amino-4,6-dideoxygalactose transaminase
MNSGTSALHVGLAALKAMHGWSDGDEVIVPAVTFVATANVVIHNNLKPVFVDVESDTYCLDPAKIEAKISSRTKAIIPVHLLGLPASMDPILEIASRYKLEVMEDSAETMFAKYKGRAVGSMGAVGCFSTYVAHFLVTGVGGFATTNNSELAVAMRSLMNHGRDGIYISSADDAGLSGKALENVVEKRFSFTSIGHSFRCTELESAIGVGQLARKDQIISRRIEIAHRYIAGLQPVAEQIQLPVTPPDRDHGFMLFGLVLRNEGKREIVNYLENLNIETRDMLPIINQPIYRDLYGDLERVNPVAKWINNSGFYVGCHSYMSDDEVDFIIDAILEYFKRN